MGHFIRSVQYLLIRSKVSPSWGSSGGFSAVAAWVAESFGGGSWFGELDPTFSWSAQWLVKSPEPSAMHVHALKVKVVPFSRALSKLEKAIEFVKGSWYQINDYSNHDFLHKDLPHGGCQLSVFYHHTYLGIPLGRWMIVGSHRDQEHGCKQHKILDRNGPRVA